MKKFMFVLGGNDGEMVLIRQLLTMTGISFVQPNVGWGDHQYSPQDLGIELQEKSVPTGGGYMYHSGYDKKIVAGKDVGNVTFIECHPADGWPEGLAHQVIDHHGDRSGEPASILQVLSVLRSTATELEGQKEFMQGEENPAVAARNIREMLDHSSRDTRRWIELVAANDAGYIPAMLALGATPDEVARVRLFDRSAQGITPEHEVEAERAIGDLQKAGRLTVVRMSHSKTATVCDRLYGHYDQLLILSGDGEVNFYGDGALCTALKEKFEGSWNGGSGLGKAGENAFWGGYPKHEEVVAFIGNHFTPK